LDDPVEKSITIDSSTDYLLPLSVCVIYQACFLLDDSGAKLITIGRHSSDYLLSVEHVLSPLSLLPIGRSRSQVDYHWPMAILQITYFPLSMCLLPQACFLLDDPVAKSTAIDHFSHYSTSFPLSICSMPQACFLLDDQNAKSISIGQ
jgi:hypothetical protein